ncbi:MAG: LLM class F420-dependent oxidoreductase [Dehalococcoidia bacterium]
MKLTAFYPSSDLGSDPVVLRDYAQTAEAAGYDRIAMGEHVLGADPDRPGGWEGPYTHENEWPEPFPTFAYLASVTERVELMTGVVILPQRQTVLVAKQAAALDILSGGRFVLGIGTGWNPVEYEALDEDFHNRGQRMEEQVALLRALWRDPVVSFEGRWHHVTKAGINPRPAAGDIPIWMGGSHERVLDRVGRIGDGWFPLRLEIERVEEGMKRIRAVAAEAGRETDAIGLQGSVTGDADVEGQVAYARRLEALGATHAALFTSNLGLSSPQQHIDAIRAFGEQFQAAGA